MNRPPPPPPHTYTTTTTNPLPTASKWQQDATPEGNSLRRVKLHNSTINIINNSQQQTNTNDVKQQHQHYQYHRNKNDTNNNKNQLKSWTHPHNPLCHWAPDLWDTCSPPLSGSGDTGDCTRHCPHGSSQSLRGGPRVECMSRSLIRLLTVCVIDSWNDWLIDS